MAAGCPHPAALTSPVHGDRDVVRSAGVGASGSRRGRLHPLTDTHRLRNPGRAAAGVPLTSGVVVAARGLRRRLGGDRRRGHEAPPRGRVARHRPHRLLPGPPRRPDTDVAETVCALSDLVHHGRVLHRLVVILRFSRLRGPVGHAAVHLERFATEQPPYSILVRGIEEDVLPTVRCHGTGTPPAARSPAAGPPVATARTSLRGPPPRRVPRPLRSERPRRPAQTRRCRTARRPGGESRSHPDRAGRRLRHQPPGVTSAIIGPRTMKQLEAAGRPAAATTRAGSAGHGRSIRIPGSRRRCADGADKAQVRGSRGRPGRPPTAPHRGGPGSGRLTLTEADLGRIDEAVPAGDAPAYAVAHAYRHFLDDLREGTSRVPDFEHGAARHRSIASVITAA